MDSEISKKDEEAISLRGALDDVKIIGTGGMSQIFRARQPSLGRFIAVKRLKEELVNNAEAKERFRREAKALASVLHQNVAHVYDFVETDRESYILMEYIDGIDVSSIISKVGNIPPEIAAGILFGVCRGLHYIHSHHIVHRDIKPGNIRVNTRGETKLMDFGIVMDVENPNLTRPGMMVGSPAYLSPEQILGDPISAQTDIFLLGITFYEMLTGIKPFADDSGQTVYQKIRESDYRPIRQLQPKVPAALERIINRCLAKRPKERFRSVKSILFELENYLGSEVSHLEEKVLVYLDREALLASPVKSASEESHSTFSGKRPRTLKAVLWVVGTALLALALWGAFQWGKDCGRLESLKVQEKYGTPKKIK